MKRFLTNNIGLKLLSLFVAVVLWVVVVNIDDPVIYKTFTGIQVEVTNAESLAQKGQTYEIPDGNDVVSVTVQAERSVLESISKDYIKATADMRNLTLMSTIPIEFRSTRYPDRVSFTSRIGSIPVIIENEASKQIKVKVSTIGELPDGYIVGSINPLVSVITVKGPESLVESVNEAAITVDIDKMNESFKPSCPVSVVDHDGTRIENPMLEISMENIATEVEILETKEIPVTAGFSGAPAQGYSATGIVVCDPSSVVIAGKGAAFDNLTSISIPSTDIDITGARENASMTVNIKNYLPQGVIFAGESGQDDINVVALIESHEVRQIPVLAENIAVLNLPEGYSAHVVSPEETLMFEISGLESDLDSLTALNYTAVIDAQAMIPRVVDDMQEGPVHTGSNDGLVILNLPPNVVQNTQMMVEVVINNLNEQ